MSLRRAMPFKASSSARVTRTRRFRISMSASAEMPASFVPACCLNLSSDATGRGNAAAKRLESVSDGKQRPKAETGASRNASARTVCLNADSLTGRCCLRLPALASSFEGHNRAHNSWRTQENVQRQIAVMVVVTMEEARFLLPMQRCVRGWDSGERATSSSSMAAGEQAILL
jgi:hypothetical protein